MAMTYKIFIVFWIIGIGFNARADNSIFFGDIEKEYSNFKITVPWYKTFLKDFERSFLYDCKDFLFKREREADIAV